MTDQRRLTGNPDGAIPDWTDDELRHDRSEDAPIFRRGAPHSGKRQGVHHLSGLDADEGQSEWGSGK